MSSINPITSDDMYQAAKLVLKPFIGYYQDENNHRQMAIYFDNVPEVSNVMGLECLIPPRISNNRREGCVRIRQFSWYIALINHEGLQTIYDAAEELAKIGTDSRIIWSESDRTLGCKPSAVVKIASLTTECVY